MGFNVDFFRRIPVILTTITIVMFVAFCLWLIAIYIGVEYVRPPWDTHSVPPELLY